MIGTCWLRKLITSSVSRSTACVSDLGTLRTLSCYVETHTRQQVHVRSEEQVMVGRR